jgi:hypothetical protein
MMIIFLLYCRLDNGTLKTIDGNLKCSFRNKASHSSFLDNKALILRLHDQSLGKLSLEGPIILGKIESFVNFFLVI